MASRGHRRLAAVVVGALAIAAPLPAGASSPSQPSPAAYPSCGFYWNRNTPPSAAQRRANSCILRARREGGKARVVAAHSTVEGDPIVSYVFVFGRSPVLVVVDSTRDAFGPRRWTQAWCKGMTASHGFLHFDGCRTVERGKPAWLKPVMLRG